MFEKLFDIDKSISNIICSNSELKVLYIYDFFVQTKKSLLVVTNSLFEAGKIYHALENYTSEVLFFPMDDFLTSEALAISPELQITRLETINAILKNENKIVVTNLMGFLRYLPKKEIYQEKIIKLKKDSIISKENLLKQLSELGYKREITVDRTGEMAVRGYVIDIFPIDYLSPIRIEFWDDQIDMIKLFDVNTQLTIEEINEITIKPITEFLADAPNPKQRDLVKYMEVNSIFNYLNDAYLTFINFDDIRVSYEHLMEETYEYSKSIELDPTTKYMFDLNDINSTNMLYIDEFNSEKSLKEKSLNIDAQELSFYNLTIPDLKEEFSKYLKKNKTVVLCLNSKNNLKKIYDILEESSYVITTEKDIKENKVNLIVKTIDSGFIYKNYVILSEKELLNKKQENQKYKTSFTMGSKIRDINKLEIGDYVVHYKYGIGRYNGLKTLKKGDLMKEYLMVEYAGTDKLYIPVEKIDLIKKYSNSDASIPKLNRLNSLEWQKTKAKAAKRIEDIAESLLKLYALREATPGFAFEKDTDTQLEFEQEFAFTETSDQIKVIKEIKKDMERSVPMDRLLCGDVGFGKTEVAFRAMFKAVCSNKQVAYLCPTTILSNQQYNSSLQRFKNFPVNIALLNRYTSKKDETRILNELKEGKIDILFGTHRILSNDIEFKDIGLLVVDEEQRFGVTHKEKIKKYKSNIDVLTLSATPIPRTLQMSMVGLRSLSLIETPPFNRYPVQTYVLEENNHVIKDAIYKELSRDGQVYILCNRIESFEEKIDELTRLIPDIKIGYAHGKMTKNEMEDIMYKFINKEFNVLLCTTIIETGIDIPNVNTLIILDAERFGLSQLYQIRGRVGRSNRVAYAYLMYGKHKVLSEIATKRLSAIKEFAQLGSGFSIAMRDLSIRGAGDILGSEQSGFIDTIGIELYLRMLNEEIDKISGVIPNTDEEDDNNNSQPSLNVETHIEDSYVNDDKLKIEIHKIINEINSIETLKQAKAKIEDRFGKISENMEIYMYEELFESMRKEKGIEIVKQTDKSIELSFSKDYSNRIKADELFINAYKISRNFKLSYVASRIVLTLSINNLDKHWIYYIIELMNNL